VGWGGVEKGRGGGQETGVTGHSERPTGLVPDVTPPALPSSPVQSSPVPPLLSLFLFSLSRLLFIFDTAQYYWVSVSMP
jgi:hypothetical protein